MSEDLESTKIIKEIQDKYGKESAKIILNSLEYNIQFRESWMGTTKVVKWFCCIASACCFASAIHNLVTHQLSVFTLLNIIFGMLNWYGWIDAEKRLAIDKIKIAQDKQSIQELRIQYKLED